MHGHCRGCAETQSNRRQPKCGPKYKVEIVAPPRLPSCWRPIWTSSAGARARMSLRINWRQLYLTAPEQIETLLATEGYFSPKVQSTLEEPPGKWIARFDIAPGEPTTVTSVADRLLRCGHARSRPREAIWRRRARRSPSSPETCFGRPRGRRRRPVQSEASRDSDSPPRT